MGIKHFYSWYRKNYDSTIYKKIDEKIDVLAIDLNGIYHSCAQKLYRYGNISPYLLYTSNYNSSIIPKNSLTLYRKICDKLENIIHYIKPKKKLVLCTDGVAGLGKLNQQRQRRFKSSVFYKPIDSSFDPNSFSPGTKLMDHLTKYIDWYIRNMMTNNYDWKNLEIIFSNEKVPGEGEHKISEFIKYLCNDNDIICIYSGDSDLILLSLISNKNNIIILRELEETFYEYIYISKFKQILLEKLNWNESTFDPNLAIQDFIFLFSFIGNDFIPNVPLFSLKDRILELIISVYKENGKKYGHIIDKSNQNNIIFNKLSFISFLKEISKYEINIIEKKYNIQDSFFPDPIILKYLKLENDKLKFNDNYNTFKNDYYQSRFPKIDIKEIIYQYLDGLLWIINYYKNGMKNWIWFYPFQYAPFLSDIILYLNDYIPSNQKKTQPISSFLQLLMIIPTYSKDLLPYPLSKLLEKDSPLINYYPETFEIDLTGKSKDWEGIVLLPFINLYDFEYHYNKLKRNISLIDNKRNIVGKNFNYKFNKKYSENYVSFYGNINNSSIFLTTFNIN